MSHNFISKVTEALGQLLVTETDYNVIVHIGKEPNSKEFHAHSIILRCRSEYFNNLFSTKNIEESDGKYIIKRPNISPQAFDIILKYFYTGKINITNETGTELLDLMIASDECMLEKLSKLTEDFIVKEQQQFLQNDPVGILQIIYCRKTFVELQKYCLDRICSDSNNLFESDKFTQLPAPLLEIILKRDDLKLEEIEIWDNLIKWGLAQEQTLNKNVTRWNQNDINTFKKILDKFIPLIRFYDISARDYFNKVKPYEEILPKELRDDILKSYMISEYKPIYTPRHLYIDSIMINRKQLTIFANWIDKMKENVTYINDIPYKFNLLYRASRDGNTAAAFHAKCDDKGATIVVVKITNSEQIVGGYNPLKWDSSNSRKQTNDSFIFSFSYRSNLQTANVVYSQNNDHSIQCYSYCGPVFGLNDLYINYDDDPYNWYHDGSSSYPTINIPNCTNVDDYEVFQVIKI
ncbi:BTB/POZ domain-containing protein [Rhizophagus irregularis DAOM 181602=DAOM 197198]|uniref:Uncharacterized protein n=2 Tax=Rhizophagus irregularis TaxID=588596 RepID=U9UIT2_RHIID|nr:hypothetical protein GLOIN_2v1763821 [Rhizophagus irregularis DAOM 181602=DAOM 197198]EXX75066.1 hypothetical protein RirG_045180 [Rhizophagus irregularis DAOM 197198w]POG80881.1 hypothetical protein GLOIN_2v1763821 [Rhizophagus irregularis DAOM 181602=DAOM 197198]GBC21656.1 BTB/POZ domain-containing protein [Rhizophagus irregularis DAOM 181602=DAOM 197198]|eukprot:XP_025187747.1 hypothetical protein GLOIN_2v1763821 [Rhizophagus irregularis DAOM 181602=DAOM 197198]